MRDLLINSRLKQHLLTRICMGDVELSLMLPRLLLYVVNMQMILMLLAHYFLGRFPNFMVWQNCLEAARCRMMKCGIYVVDTGGCSHAQNGG
jgi:hypothetical protein